MRSVSEVGSAATLPKETELLADEQINERKRIRSLSDEEDTKKKGIGSLDKSTIGVTLGPYADEEKNLKTKRFMLSKHILKIDDENMLAVRLYYILLLTIFVCVTNLHVLKKRFDVY